MGIKKAMICPGNRFKRVSYGDSVTVKYSGHVFDIQRPQHGFRGKQSADFSFQDYKSKS